MAVVGSLRQISPVTAACVVWMSAGAKMLPKSRIGIRKIIFPLFKGVSSEYLEIERADREIKSLHY